MKLSILMPWRDIGDTWRNQAFQWITSRYRWMLPDAELILGSDTQPVFNISEARNNAFLKSTGDVLLFADTDTYIPIEQIEAGISLLQQDAAWVIPYGTLRYYNLTRRQTSYILKFPHTRPLPEPSDPEHWDHKITSWSGLVMLNRDAYERVGGFDEGFVGWGGEDNAFQIALDLTVGPLQRAEGYALHFWHPRGAADFSQPFWPQNKERLDRYKAARTVDDLRGIQ